MVEETHLQQATDSGPKTLGVSTLSKMEVDSRFARERRTEDNDEKSGVHDVTSKSDRLISETKLSATASRRDIDMAP